MWKVHQENSNSPGNSGILGDPITTGASADKTALRNKMTKKSAILKIRDI